MKKYLAILCLLLSTNLWAADVQLARMNVGVISGTVSAAACTSANSTTAHNGLYDDTATTRSTYTTDKFGSQFVLDANSTITHYKACLSNNVQGTADISIYNDSSNTLGTQVAGSVINVTVLVAAPTWSDCSTNDLVVGTLASPLSLSAGTYWVVVDNSSGNNLVGAMNGAPGGGRRVLVNDTDYTTTNNSIRIGVWGCTP